VALLQHGSILVDDDPVVPSRDLQSRPGRTEANPAPATLHTLLGGRPDIEEGRDRCSARCALLEGVRDASELTEGEIREEALDAFRTFSMRLERPWPAMRYAPLLCALFVCGMRRDRIVHGESTGGTLGFSHRRRTGRLDTIASADRSGWAISDMIYDRLADIGVRLTYSTTAIHAGLADRWTWSADSRRIAFHINPAAGGTTLPRFARTTFASPLPAPGIPRSDHP